MLGRYYAALIIVAVIGLPGTPSAAEAEIYSQAELRKDEVRLRNAVFRIYSIGLEPSLTGAERDAIGDVDFRFPYPEEKDVLLNFAATTDGRFLLMPLLSLKALEDLTIAYAWLYHRGLSLSTIDLYFTMLRYHDPKDFPGGKFPPILKALGVPADALKDPKVDDLSLRLRNEAFAFVIAHELGHIRFRHRPLDEITAEQAQHDEADADRFGLDLLGRTGTPALGAVLFFQAQIYGLLHHSEFRSEREWRDYVKSKMTHPLSVERIKAMAAYMVGPLARSRPAEAAIWTGIAGQLLQAVAIMEDDDLARCVVRVAKAADPSILKPREGVESAQMLARCRNPG